MSPIIHAINCDFSIFACSFMNMYNPKCEGGAILIRNRPISASISHSQFLHCYSIRDGGAIAFCLIQSSQLNCTYFERCQSFGNGQAIFSQVKSEGSISFQRINFSSAIHCQVDQPQSISSNTFSISHGTHVFKNINSSNNLLPGGSSGFYSAFSQSTHLNYFSFINNTSKYGRLVFLYTFSNLAQLSFGNFVNNIFGPMGLLFFRGDIWKVEKCIFSKNIGSNIFNDYQCKLIISSNYFLEDEPSIKDSSKQIEFHHNQFGLKSLSISYIFHLNQDYIKTFIPYQKEILQTFSNPLFNYFSLQLNNKEKVGKKINLSIGKYILVSFSLPFFFLFLFHLFA